MEKSQNLSGAKIGVVPANMTLLTEERTWACCSWAYLGMCSLLGLGHLGQKSGGGMYCSLHNEKYGQIGISLSPKMGRGAAAPEGSRA